MTIPAQSSTPSPVRNTHSEKFSHQLLLGQWVKAIYLNKVWCYQIIASKLLIKFQCSTEDNFSTWDILLPNYLLCHLLYNFMSWVWSTFSPDFRWLSLLLDQQFNCCCYRGNTLRFHRSSGWPVKLCISAGSLMLCHVLLQQTESLDTFVESKKQRLEEPPASCLLPPCISPIPNHRITSTKE